MRNAALELKTNSKAQYTAEFLPDQFGPTFLDQSLMSFNEVKNLNKTEETNIQGKSSPPQDCCSTHTPGNTPVNKPT
jgi:hypothetical protein